MCVCFAVGNDWIKATVLVAVEWNVPADSSVMKILYGMKQPNVGSCLLPLLLSLLIVM